MSYAALLRAAQAGDAPALRALLDAGVPPDLEGPRGGPKRAIHAALTRKGVKGPGHHDCVRLLAEAGADLGREGKFQDLSPLRLAAAGGHKSLVDLLLALGAPVTACDAAAIHRPGPAVGDDSQGRSPLCALAASRLWREDPEGVVPTLERLLAAGAAPDAPLTAPRTRPLWWAVAWGRSPEVFTLLLDAGASPQGCVADAAYHGLDGFVRALVSRGADLEERTPNGFTTLLHALVFRRYAILELLLELGADPSAQTTKGQDALEVATLSKAPESVIALFA